MVIPICWDGRAVTVSLVPAICCFLFIHIADKLEFMALKDVFMLCDEAGAVCSPLLAFAPMWSRSKCTRSTLHETHSLLHVLEFAHAVSHGNGRTSSNSRFFTLVVECSLRHYHRLPLSSETSSTYLRIVVGATHSNHMTLTRQPTMISNWLCNRVLQVILPIALQIVLDELLESKRAA